MSTTPGEALETNPTPPGELQFRELLAQAPAAMAFLSGPDLRWTYVNPLLVRVSGRRIAEELLGFTLRESFPELQGTGLFEIAEQVYQSGESFCGREYCIRLVQTETNLLEDRYFDFVIQPVTDSAGSRQGLFIHAVDLTDRVLGRRAIEISETRLRLAQEAAQIGTWEWDPVENRRTLSNELHRMFGTSPDQDEEQIFRTWSSRIHPADTSRVLLEMAETQRIGTMELEYRYNHPVHGLRIFYSKGRRMIGSSQFFGVVLDVTARRTAEGQLLEQRERFEFATDAAQIGYWFCDLPFDKLIWDDHVKAHFWLPPDASVDIGLFYQMLHPDDRERTQLALEAAIANHTPYDIEYRTLSPEGRQKWIRAIGRTAYDSTGRALRFDGITQDVTALKETREALIRSEKLAVVGRMAASISHEINNPLAAVTNLLFLIDTNSTDETVKTFCRAAQDELARVSQIVTHTLRFNRQTHGASSEKISELLDSSAAIYLARFKECRVEVVRDYRETARVVCLGSEMRQVFANLIANSFDASKRGGKLQLRTHDQTHWKTGERGVRITIADTGHGMSKSTLQKLFEPFFSTKGDQGTGLGLWLSREILRKHGAVLCVKSRPGSQHSGTAFSIWLPLVASPERKG